MPATDDVTIGQTDVENTRQRRRYIPIIPIQKILQTLLFKYSIIPADETRVAAEKRLSGRDAPTETGREDAQSLSSVG